MTFALSDELLDSIISAMENQEQVFVVYAENGALVALNEFEEITPDEETFYSLPEWGPADGFAMREEFVNDLHNPQVHQQLQAVLHSGRGVFKNFRNVLKDYPEIDKRWHIYKQKFMSARINEWYNSLREIWGLEKLEQLPDEEESIVSDDFSFRNYNSTADSQTVISNVSAAFLDDVTDLPEQVKLAILDVWKAQFLEADSANQIGYVCQSYSEDFAGVITASTISKYQEQTVVITSLFVPEQFRGLGISSELLSKCISELQRNGKQWILLPNIIVPDFIQPLLTRTGFKKISSGYLLSN